MSRNVVATSQLPVEDFLGIQFQFFVTPKQIGETFAFMRNIMTPHAVVPIHRHASPEIFLVESGALDVYVEGNGWQTARVGEVAWVPGNAKHALRTNGDEPMVGLHIVNSDLYHLFQADTRPFDPVATPGPPSPERLQKVAELIHTFGGWLGGPEDNAAIGLHM